MDVLRNDFSISDETVWSSYIIVEIVTKLASYREGRIFHICPYSPLTMENTVVSPFTELH